MERFVLEPPALGLPPQRQRGSRSLFTGYQDDYMESSDDEDRSARSLHILAGRRAKASSKPQQRPLAKRPTLRTGGLPREEKFKPEAKLVISKEPPSSTLHFSTFSLRRKASKVNKGYQKAPTVEHRPQSIAKEQTLRDAPGESGSFHRAFPFGPTLDFSLSSPSPVGLSVTKGKFTKGVELPRRVGRYWSDKGSAKESGRKGTPH